MSKHAVKKKQLFQEIKSDLYRYEGRWSLRLFLKSFFFSHLGFKLSVYYRINHHLYRTNKTYLARIFSFIYNKLSKKYGVDIPYKTKIGLGLYMPHPFTIIINPNCIIGNNCNLHQSVTIGASGRYEDKGFPTIRDNTYIGPGAKIFGDITIHSNCAIGANCVLNTSTKENDVMVGIPARKISNKGVRGLLKNMYNEES